MTQWGHIQPAQQVIQRLKVCPTRPGGHQPTSAVMALSRQALLSTAELINCAELGVRDISTDEKLMDALYNDEDTTPLP